MNGHPPDRDAVDLLVALEPELVRCRVLDERLEGKQLHVMTAVVHAAGEGTHVLLGPGDVSRQELVQDVEEPHEPPARS
jgi:hypothetical protein